MANIRKYKDTEEAKQAQREQRSRYIEKNLIRIEVKIPKEYGPKLEYITKKMNISRAQFIKMCIDATYSELKEKELQQPSSEESNS